MSASPSLEPQPVLLLIDGHSLAYRAYYAFAYSREGGLRTSTGIPTSVCFGFLKVLLEVLETQKSSSVAIAFDTRQPTFRHTADDTYKAGRPETPEDFITDIENLKELLVALNIPILTAPGFEADDILGTLAHQARHLYQVKILSGDQDLFQLIDPEQRITVLHLNTKDRITPFSFQEVKDKLGVWPWQVVDYKALCGDSSDNIPGVKGIGQKRAVELLEQYGDLDSILAAIPQMKGAMQTRLSEGIEAARHSQFMARIRVDVPLELDWTAMKLTGFDQATLIPCLQKLEFNSMIAQVQNIQTRLGGSPVDPVVQGNVIPSPAQATNAPPLDEADKADEEDTWFGFADLDGELANRALGNRALGNRALGNRAQSSLPPVQIIDTLEKLHHWVAVLRTLSSPVAWDTETTGLDVRDAQLVGIGCCWGDQEVAYIPLAHTQGSCLPWDVVKPLLAPLWADPAYPKIFQNNKFDCGILRSHGVEVAGVVFDPMLASYVLDPEAKHGLDDLALRWLGMQKQSYAQLVNKKQTIADIAIPQVAAYCGADALATFRLTPLLQEQLAANPRLQHLFAEIELPLSRVLLEMEWLGIHIDSAFLHGLSQELETELDHLESTAYQQAGETFNLNSPKQLGTVLFEKLKLPLQKSRKTATGYSTDAAVLEKLIDDHPLVETLVQHRTLAKLKSTYVDALPLLVRKDTERIHTDFNQTVTTTGRLSSSNPNLQNIPIRTEFSRRIRQAFIPQPGWLLVSADYSQIELRILAHLSQEMPLIAGFQAGEDVHTLTARLLLNKTEVTTEERRLAKTINYGVIYGMGAQRFARATGLSMKEAQTFIQRFNQQYTRIFEYMHQVEEEVQQVGYVETVLGRRRYFPNLNRLSGFRKQAELRAAVNAPIQGSASDLIKIAMVNLHRKLQGAAIHLLLQVHDELVFEVDPSEWPDLKPIIRQEMETALSLSVPLTVDIQSGQNWCEAK